MLASSARRTIISALYPSSESQPAVESIVFSTLPSQNPLEWLQAFGQPVRSGDPREVHGPFSISALLLDKRPLNINLTGALIENVVGYLDQAKQFESRTAVPHLIRNDSGMVSPAKCRYYFVSFLMFFYNVMSFYLRQFDSEKS
jgi:hypothetical protein